MYLFVWILVKRGLLHERGSSCFLMSTDVHWARSCGDGHRCHKYGSDVGQSHLLGPDKGDKGGRWPFSAPDTACAGGAVFEERGKRRLPFLASCLLFMVVAKMRRSRLALPGSEYLPPHYLQFYKPCAMGPLSLCKLCKPSSPELTALEVKKVETMQQQLQLVARKKPKRPLANCDKSWVIHFRFYSFCSFFWQKPTKRKTCTMSPCFLFSIAEWFSFTFPVCGLPNNLSFGYYWLLKQIFLVVAINHDLLICVSWLVMKFTRQKPWTVRTSTNSFQTHKKIPDVGSVRNENQ